MRRAIETVLSTSTANPMWPFALAPYQVSTSSSCPKVTNFNSPTTTRTYYPVAGTRLYGLPISGGTLTFYASDSNTNRFNPLPAGTTVSVKTTTGLSASVNGGSPVPSTNSANLVTIGYTWSGATTGTISVSFTTPKGFVTSVDIFVATDLPNNPIPSGYQQCN